MSESNGSPSTRYALDRMIFTTNEWILISMIGMGLDLHDSGLWIRAEAASRWSCAERASVVEDTRRAAIQQWGHQSGMFPLFRTPPESGCQQRPRGTTGPTSRKSHHLRFIHQLINDIHLLVSWFQLPWSKSLDTSTSETCSTSSTSSSTSSSVMARSSPYHDYENYFYI